MFHIYNNVYCEYCFNESFIWCPDCGVATHNNDTVHIQNKEIYVCQYCANKHYYKCETCGDYYELDNVQIFNDSIYCESCFDEIADRCENCSEPFYIEDLTSVNNSGSLCDDCATKIQETEGIVL